MKSSIRRIEKLFNDKAIGSKWDPTIDRNNAFVEEYKKMVRNGVNNAKTYNKIWSPGRRIHKDLFGFLLD